MMRAVVSFRAGVNDRACRCVFWMIYKCYALAHHVSHFLEWWPKMHDAHLYPGFLDYEVWRGDDRLVLSSRPSTRVSWRMNQFEVAAHGSNLYMVPEGYGQRGYILTSDMLSTVMESDWVHKSPVAPHAFSQLPVAIHV